MQGAKAAVWKQQVSSRDGSHARELGSSGAARLLRRLRCRLLRRRLLLCACERPRRRRRVCCPSPPPPPPFPPPRPPLPPPILALPPSTPPLLLLSGPLAMSPESPGSRTFSRYFCSRAHTAPAHASAMQPSSLPTPSRLKAWYHTASALSCGTFDLQKPRAAPCSVMLISMAGQACSARQKHGRLRAAAAAQQPRAPAGGS